MVFHRKCDLEWRHLISRKVNGSAFVEEEPDYVIAAMARRYHECCAAVLVHNVNGGAASQ